MAQPMKRTLWLLASVGSLSLVPGSLPSQLQDAALEVGDVVTTTSVQGDSRSVQVLDAVTASTTSGPVTLYAVAYQAGQLDAEQQWQPLCNPDIEGDTHALALSGQWDSAGNYLNNDEITFACTSGVIGKCALWGYHPEDSPDMGQNAPRQRHQACTRMARADYCGDGTSHTLDGTEIEVYDPVINPGPTPDSGMHFEAAWGPDGAVWIERTRWPAAMAYVQINCPERLGDKALSLAEVQSHPDAVIFNDSLVRP